MFSTVDSGLTMTVVVVLCSLSSVSSSVCLFYAGCVQSSVNKPGANRRVSYDSLTHTILYCRDRGKSRS